MPCIQTTNIGSFWQFRILGAYCCLTTQHAFVPLLNTLPCWTISWFQIDFLPPKYFQNEAIWLPLKSSIFLLENKDIKIKGHTDDLSALQTGILLCLKHLGETLSTDWGQSGKVVLIHRVELIIKERGAVKQSHFLHYREFSPSIKQVLKNIVQ